MFAAYLGADHEKASVRFFQDITRLQRLSKTRPARAGVELVPGAEERLTCDNVYVDARLMVVPVFVFEGRLGAANVFLEASAKRCSFSFA